MPARLGPWGEQLAAIHLESRGWTILARNYRIGRNEIDLVALRDGVVAFVEVKARRGSATGHPLEGITERKRRDIARVAEGWVREFGTTGWHYRFDAVALRPGHGGRVVVEHVEDAWGI